ncbi:lipopolysaccharide biosynthesis protein [Gramella sp. GC03-9]|uniref:Lipopolysaccharide biosynthesis protein n=1 Tax=Christiangramia oceanisediminis TaxID=2920386 RepID=A0A9X2I295_9FLAO|nr:lipopolysaccharide biosynthesis protein [Gramella oceanisediminis]MCP9199894.1 lipopolysaccharide biosynthesis protein [Gramella oceanisediminis]
MSTTNKIFSGIFWTSMQAVIQRAFRFLVKLFLARLLFPEDFGIVGMAVVFTSFIQVFSDLGFGQALIQRKKENLSDNYYNTAFWTNIGWSIIIYLIIAFIIGPFSTWFYGEEILNKIIPVLGVSVLINPIILVHRAKLTRDLNFKKLAIINNSSNIGAGILAIILAYTGFGVWALIFNTIAQFLIAVPLYFFATKWTPKLIWNKESFKDLFGFGIFTSSSALISRFANQGDYLLIGKFIGKIELGLYSFAFIITDAIRSQIKSVINSVLFPVYSQYQDEKSKQFKIYTKSIFYNSLTIVPLMCVLFFATNALLIFFGDKWEASLIIIKIIAISAIIETITTSFPSLLRANNLPGLEFKIEAIKVLVFYLPLIYLGVIYNGIVGAASGVLISRILGAVINLIVMERWLNLSSIIVLKEFFKGFLPSLISLIMCYVIFFYFDSEFIFKPILKAFCLVTLITFLTYILNKKDLEKLYVTFKNRKNV